MKLFVEKNIFSIVPSRLERESPGPKPRMITSYTMELGDGEAKIRT